LAVALFLVLISCSRTDPSPHVYAGYAIQDGQVVDVGEMWTYGTPQILNYSASPITFKQLEFVGIVGGFRPVTVRLAGPDRGQNVLAAPGFPAAEHNPGALAPVSGFVAPRDAITPAPNSNLGTEVIIAFRLDHPGIAGFHGLRLTYVFKEHTYVLEVPDSFVACSRNPGETLAAAADRCSRHLLRPAGKPSPFLA
jgi:hypothetical protein